MHQPSEEEIASIDEAISRRRCSLRASFPGKGEEKNEGNQTESQIQSKTPTTEAKKKYEYLDHTADIQLHSWGSSLQEALEQLVLCLFHYMTDLSTIEFQKDISEQNGRCLVAEGHDLYSLIYSYLNEWLCNFFITGFIPKVVRIQRLDREGPYKIISEGDGELFDLSKHPQGSEVKAITYSNMQVIENDKKSCWDIYVIVDI